MPSDTTDIPTTDLRASLARWVRAGLISPQQSEGIAAFETGEVPSAAPAPPRRLSVLAELVTYLGIALVLAAGFIAVSRLWSNLGLGGQVAVGAAVALLGFIGGTAVMRLKEESTTRLGWFLWFCGTGGVAMTTAIVADRVSSGDAGWTVMSTGLAVLLVSVGLWRNLDRPLQFLSSVAGLSLSVGGLNTLAGWHLHLVLVGSAIWVASVGLGALAQRVVRPGVVATLVAEVGVSAGAMAMMNDNHALGLILGLLGAAAGVTLGLRTHVSPVLALGVLSFFFLLIRLLSFYLRGPGGILVVFVIGVALVSAVIWRATRHHGPNATSGGWHLHMHR